MKAIALVLLAACTTGTELESEDEGPAGGKADDFGFTLGHYVAAESLDEVADQFPVAVFMPPSSTTPSRDTGAVDFAMFDDGSYRAVQGSFRVYRSNGRDRIRISDEAGNVVARTDWSRSGNDIILGSYNLHQLAHEADSPIACLALDVFGGDFEESFTIHEYPDVRVTRREDGTGYEASVGAMLFSADDNDAVTVDVANGTTTAKIVAASGLALTIAVPDAAPRRAEILLDGAPIADIICR